MKIHSAISLIIFTVYILICSCSKDNDPNVFYYDDTYCANPWDSYYTADSFSLNALNQAIDTFFRNENIQVNSIHFGFDSSKIEYCYACHCTSGRIIVVNAASCNNPKMSSLNFYQ
ncbi:MAG: hypothetical protein MK207_05755 [Saprospiraceae bacterium]|nr:hypothetical protein [Saprospiraceae bacterium]